MYFFCLHRGHLRADANRIAARHGASHTNYTDPGTGERRGWFAGPNLGAPFDRALARAVERDIDAAGGLDALRHKKDRWTTLNASHCGCASPASLAVRSNTPPVR